MSIIFLIHGVGDFLEKYFSHSRFRRLRRSTSSLPPQFFCGTEKPIHGLTRKKLLSYQVPTMKPHLFRNLLASVRQMNAIRSSGLALIAAERARQIAEEGWTPEHDDTHTEGELARAAAAYALPYWIRRLDARNMTTNQAYTLLTRLWPWGTNWWKPTPEDRVRELVKAGALIVAEVDRVQRQNKISS